MPADASIYGLMRPQATVKLEDPDEIRAKRLQISNLMQQQEAGQLGLQHTRRGMEREDAFTRLFSGGRNPTEAEMFAVDPKGAAATLKARQDAKKTGAETGKIETETLEKALKIHYDMLKDVNDPQTAARWITAGYNDPMLSPVMQRAGSPQEVIARIPQDPKGFEEWRMRNGMGLEKFAADLREKQRIAETGRHNVATETNAAGQLAVSRGNLGVAQGNLGVSRARLEHEKATPQRTYDAERGIVVNTRDGTAAPVMVGGVPLAGKEKELNDAQAKALLYSNRMNEAEEIIGNLAAKGVNVSTPGSRSGFGVGAAINVLNTDERQQLDQAKRNFINAVLRRESGAVISDSEFANAEQQYFPQAGDGDGVKANKAANRKTAIDGIQAEVPKSKRPTAQPKTPKEEGRKVVNGKTYVKVNGQWFEEN